MIRFKTYTELIEKFPIGKIYANTVHWASERFFYYNEQDLSAYRNASYLKDIKIIDENTISCLVKRGTTYCVEAYLFDGLYWYPMRENGDGWQPIFEEEVNFYDCCET